jgi:beta-galactosidase/beta-glucuronidase
MITDPPVIAPRSEHPRPNRFRPTWQTLNGTWRFATDHERRGIDQRWFAEGRLHRDIVVPFAYQHELSGINHKGVEEIVWYARDFDVPAEWLGDDRSLLLHFGAVDYRCTVWINGAQIGMNEGGHVPFEFDIATACVPGQNHVVLRVEDPQDPTIPRGKQAISGVPGSIFYFCTTGIWQSVWLEPVSKVRIEDLVLTTRLGGESGPDTLFTRAYIQTAAPGAQVRVELSENGARIASVETPVRNGIAESEITVASAKRWSPESPALYDVKATVLVEDTELDSLQSYVGFRSAEVVGGQFLLNGEPYYLRMVLDQGYWPSSGITAPTDDALREDVEWCKKLGFNGARKHQKVEDPRWLYWCDRLGLLVWGEMANAFAWSHEAADRLTREWERAVRRDRNHPCVVTWVPVNESWGVPYLRQGHPEQIALLERLVALTRSLDGTRPVVDNDGWEHTDSAEMYTLHDYSKTGKEIFARFEPAMKGGPMQIYTQGNDPMWYLAKGARYRGQPVLLTEVGGFLSIPPGVPKENWDSLYGSYAVLESDEALIEKYSELMDGIASVPFIVGFCYTQLADVEQEANGLLTYDRRPKVSPDAIRSIHERMTSSRKGLL